MPSNKKKGYALELVDDPVIKHNFDMVVKQIQDIKDSLRCGGYKESSPDTGVSPNYDGTSFQDVTALLMNYKSYGNPIFIGLAPKYADNTYAATIINAVLGGSDGRYSIKLFRDGNVIAKVSLGTAFAVSPAAYIVQFPPSIFWHIDPVKGGDHQYKIQVAGAEAVDRIIFDYVKMVMFEIPMALLT